MKAQRNAQRMPEKSSRGQGARAGAPIQLASAGNRSMASRTPSTAVIR